MLFSAVLGSRVSDRPISHRVHDPTLSLNTPMGPCQDVTWDSLQSFMAAVVLRMPRAFSSASERLIVAPRDRSSDLVFEMDAITRMYFPRREYGRVNSGALVVLLNNTLQDLRRRLAGCGVKCDHDAAFVYLGDSNASSVAQAQNAANPLQLIEGRTTLKIH